MRENEPFEFEVQPGHNGFTRILRISGPLIIQNIFELQAELRSAYCPVTIFDLSCVPYMDSAGIGVIINSYVSAKRRGYHVMVAGTNPRVFELFKLTHVDTVIPMTETVEEAEGLD